MSNLLNSILSNQSIQPSIQAKTPEFTFDADGKVKPLNYKGKLLPSRLFATPKEYAHDLKQDILSIGKAAKGKANDYELGRINDVAMKLGSLGLASYLFIKNPLKLDKAMQFIGFGTFFGGMALWPKLAIQAPLRARTGVDIHQKYIDSQGRKKMLHQDPQYDLTDLYSREDLDTMGEKLKVSDDIHDRDNFIKQRAKKTAIQGNTLWMMSSFVTPILSAMGCKALEEPVGNLIEKGSLISSAINLEKGMGPVQKIKNFFAEKSLQRFLRKNSGKAMTDELISQITQKLGDSANSADISAAIKESLKQMKQKPALSADMVSSAIAGIKDISSEKIAAAMTNPEVASAIESGSVDKVADLLSKAAFDGKRTGRQSQVKSTIKNLINKSIKEQSVSDLTDEVAGKIKGLQSSLLSFSSDRALLDKYLGARVVEKDGTFIARQWNRVCTKVLKILKLNDAELSALANGEISVLDKKFTQLAADSAKYEQAIAEITKLINKYEAQLGNASEGDRSFISKVQAKAHEMCAKAVKGIDSDDLSKVADAIKTSENTIVRNAGERTMGAQSSFYRLLQTFELYKQLDKNAGGDLTSKLTEALKKQGIEPTQTMIDKLLKSCKHILLEAKTTDYTEKLAANNFNLSQNEYKAVMSVLFDTKNKSTQVKRVLEKQFGPEETAKILKGFESYKSQFREKVVNWENPMKSSFADYLLDEATHSPNATERSNLVGSTVKDTIQGCARKMKNTKFWTKMFGISLAVITAATLIIGLTFGRKSKMEKQAEQESKING